jgi:hypothetical protein
MNAVLNETRFVAADSQADYDAWLAREVQEALDDPRPTITHTEVLRRSAIRREELLSNATC